MPYVFSAQGRVYLSPAPIPRRLFMSPTKSKIISPRKTRLQSKKKPLTPPPPPPQELTESDTEPGQFNDSHPFFGHQRDIKFASLGDDVDSDYASEDDGQEDFLTEMLPEKWNDPEDKFAGYYRRYMGVPLIDLPGTKKPFGSLYNDEEEDDELDYDPATDDTLICLSTGIDADEALFPSSSPPPVPASSSPQKGLRFPSSSAYSSPQKGRSSDWSLTDLPSPSLYSPSQFNKSLFAKAKLKQTPAPPRTKVERMRAERIERKIEKSKRGKILNLKDVVEDKAEQSAEPVDDEDADADGELVDEGEGEEEKEEDQLDPEEYETYEAPDPETWDPFDDEQEI